MKKLYGLFAVVALSIPFLSNIASAGTIDIFTEYRDPSLTANEICVLKPTNLKVGYVVDWQNTGGTGLYFSNDYLSELHIWAIEFTLNIEFQRNELGPLLIVFTSNKCPADMTALFISKPPRTCKVGASISGNGIPLMTDLSNQQIEGIVYTCVPNIPSELTIDSSMLQMP